MALEIDPQGRFVLYALNSIFFPKFSCLQCNAPFLIILINPYILNYCRLYIVQHHESKAIIEQNLLFRKWLFKWFLKSIVELWYTFPCFIHNHNIILYFIRSGPCCVISFLHIILSIYGCTRSSWCAGFSLVAVSEGYSVVAVLGLLIVMASPAAEHGL